VRRVLSSADLTGRRILVVTGPTREPLDPVRFISNRSSGKMGVALAREAFCRGAHVEMIHGPAVIRVPSEVPCTEVITASEMFEAVMRRTFEDENPPDIVIMAAAVADFRPREVDDHKIKKTSAKPLIALEQNPDILFELGKRRKSEKRPLLVGFAVETGEIEELLAQLRDKLEKKNADVMVGNFADDAFDLDTNRVWIMSHSVKHSEVSTTYKSRVANKILDVVSKT